MDLFLLPISIEADFNNLWNEHPQEFGKVKIYGKEIFTPRWQQSYGIDYYFSGILHKALDIPPHFKEIYDWANTTKYGPFNQMMVNWYKDGSHYIGAHRDDEKGIEKDSNILSISLGAKRKFRVRCYHSKKIKKDIILEDKSVLVMSGTFNTEYTHEIVKIGGEKGKLVGPRINITFRKFV
jgi:alkylated DNA repair dioxygenase AlkB